MYVIVKYHTRPEVHLPRQNPEDVYAVSWIGCHVIIIRNGDDEGVILQNKVWKVHASLFVFRYDIIVDFC